MNPTEKSEMQVAEDPDGSAVAILPEGDISPQNEARNDSNDGDDDDHPADNIPHADPEREALRLARRDERQLKKRLQKAKQSESTHLITSLRRQNDQMAERLSVLEKRTAGSDLARLDKAIEDGHLRLQYAKAKLKEAAEMADGTGMADANEAWYDARRQVESLEALKRKAVSSEPDRNAVPRAPDPLLKRHASDWMARNDWYDPNGGDTDSQVATKVDEGLVADGWDPKSADYWVELDNRLTKYLPHRYNAGNDNQSSNRRPRTVVTSSGRESSTAQRGNEFRLSPERVKAIKDAGRWENVTDRNKMIRKYAEYDRMNTNTRG